MSNCWRYEVGGVINRHHVPLPFPGFENVQRGVIHGDAFTILFKRHVHDVAGQQAADGPVANHCHVSTGMSLRHVGQEGFYAFNQLLATFAFRRSDASRVLFPGPVDVRIGTLALFIGPALLRAITQFNQTEVGWRNLATAKESKARMKTPEQIEARCFAL